MILCGAALVAASFSLAVLEGARIAHADHGDDAVQVAVR